jgi:hypothetical protein
MEHSIFASRRTAALGLGLALIFGTGCAACLAEQAQTAASAVQNQNEDGLYTDVADGDGCAKWVAYVTGRGVMGDEDGDGAFGVEAQATRAEVAVALWRMAGSPEAAYAGQFSDVADGDECAGAVAWAVSAGVVSAPSDGSQGTFRPSDAVTRQEAAVMAARYAGGQGSGDLSACADAADAADWAASGLSWCLDNGVISTEGGCASPTNCVTRAELAKMLTKLSTVGRRGVVAQSADAAGGEAAGTSSEQQVGGGAAENSSLAAAASTTASTAQASSANASSDSANNVSTSSGAGNANTGASTQSASSGAASNSSTSASGGSAAYTPAQSSSSSSSSGSTSSSQTQTQKRWVVDQAAYDETVVDKAAYDETVVDQEAWDEQVEVTPAYTTEEYTGVWYYVCNYDGYIAYTDDELDNHLWGLIESGVTYTSYHSEPEVQTVYHDATYETRHHDAQTHIEHHDAETHTVHHDEVGHWE